MNIKAIKNEADYESALERLETIFDAKSGTKEGDELEVLSILVDIYEKENYSIELPDPVEAIKFRMEQLGMKQKELGKIIGLNSRASEILHRKRKLSLEMIRQIHKALNIPTDLLIQEYLTAIAPRWRAEGNRSGKGSPASRVLAHGFNRGEVL